MNYWIQKTNWGVAPPPIITPSSRLPTLLTRYQARDFPCAHPAFSWQKTMHSYTIYECLDRALGHPNCSPSSQMQDFFMDLFRFQIMPH